MTPAFIVSVTHLVYGGLAPGFLAPDSLLVAPGSLLATLFVDPMTLSRLQQMLLLLPLCLTISIVYKTTKVQSLRELPMVVLVNWLTVIVGMYAVGGALLLLHYVAA